MSAAKLHESEVWRTTPTDLGGWANRATALLQERDYLREVLERLRNDFEWMLDEHPEHKGEYAADDDPRRPLFEGMRCKMREDWFEGNDPTDRPPPTPMNRWQHDPDGMATWARARRGSLFPWIRRRAHLAIQYAIYHREIALGWRRGSMTEWVIR